MNVCFGRATGLECSDLSHRQPEEEEMLGSDMVTDFHLRTVRRSDGRAAIQRRLRLLVPEASLPAVDICSEKSEAGIRISAIETL